MTYRHFQNESTRSSVLRVVADTENEAAWQRLFDLYAGFVFSIARSKGLNDADADDIVQVVFTDLARNFARQSYQFSPRWTPPASSGSSVQKGRACLDHFEKGLFAIRSGTGSWREVYADR